MTVTDVSAMAGTQEYCAQPPVMPTHVFGLIGLSVICHGLDRLIRQRTRSLHKQGQADG